MHATVRSCPTKLPAETGLLRQCSAAPQAPQFTCTTRSTVSLRLKRTVCMMKLAACLEGLSEGAAHTL